MFTTYIYSIFIYTWIESGLNTGPIRFIIINSKPAEQLKCDKKENTVTDRQKYSNFQYVTYCYILDMVLNYWRF
jgi:hypothetical protein